LVEDFGSDFAHKVVPLAPSWRERSDRVRRRLIGNDGTGALDAVVRVEL